MRKGRKQKAKLRAEAVEQELPAAPVPDEPEVWVEGFGLDKLEYTALLSALQRAWDKEPAPHGATALRNMIERIAVTEDAE